MTKPLTSWSYSRWALHHECPLRFKLEVLDGRKAPPNAAMAKGRRVHSAIATYIDPAPLKEGEARGLPPPEAGKAAGLTAELLRFDNRVVEQQWGYDRQWKPTGWFGKDTWLRSVLDVAVLYDDMSATVIDWKTGKPRGTYGDQLELFAVALMTRFQPVTHVEARLVFTDFAHQEIAEFPRTELDKLVAKWEDKVRPMFEDTTYLPRPNEGCKWCPFSKSNGGECRYG